MASPKDLDCQSAASSAAHAASNSIGVEKFILRDSPVRRLKPRPTTSNSAKATSLRMGIQPRVSNSPMRLAPLECLVSEMPIQMKPERMPPQRRIERKVPPAPWWLTRLREHPVKSLSTAALMTGGLLLLLLFGHIGAFPELDLGGATAALLATAVVGVVVNAVFGGSVLAIGWGMRSEDARTSWMRTTQSLCVFAAPGAIAVCVAAYQLYSSADLAPSRNLAAITAIAALVGTAFLLRKLERGSLAERLPATRWAASWFRLRTALFILGICAVWLSVALLAALTLFALFPLRISANVTDDFGNVTGLRFAGGLAGLQPPGWSSARPQ